MRPHDSEQAMGTFLRIDLPILLPDVPDAADACMERLIAALRDQQGIDEVHIHTEREGTSRRFGARHDFRLPMSRRYQRMRRSGAASTQAGSIRGHLARWSWMPLHSTRSTGGWTTSPGMIRKVGDAPKKNRLPIGCSGHILACHPPQLRAVPPTPASIPALGDLEIAVLKDIWIGGSSDVKTVHSRVGKARAITSNTVQSTLERLYRKGLLERSKSGHAYAYSAAVSCGELVHRLIEGTVSRVAGSQPELWLSAFVDLAAKADEVQLDRLEALIARRRAELDRGPC